MVPIHVGVNNEPHMVSAEELEKQLVMQMPFATANVTFREPLIASATEAPVTNMGAYLNMMDTIRAAENTHPTRHYVGYLKGACGINGLAYLGGNYTSVMKDTSCGGIVATTIAHELAHNLNIEHAPCGGAAAPDPEYANQDWEGAEQAKMSLAPIVNHNKKKIQSRDDSPDALKDVMSYCGGRYFSEYNNHKMTLFTEARDGYNPNYVEPATKEVMDYIKISGTIKKGVATFNPLSKAFNKTTYESGSDYRIKVYGEDSYSEYMVNVIGNGNDDTLFFDVNIPKTDGIKNIELISSSETIYNNEIIKGIETRTFDPEIEFGWKNGSITWDNNAYPWVSVYVRNKLNVMVAAINLEGGYAEVELPENLDLTEVEIVFSNGMTTKTFTETR